MNQVSLMLRGAALAAALCAASTPALAQQSQWNKGATTEKQRTAVLKKEINAAYAEQQSACKRQSSGQRSACMKSARQTYQRDMANVPQLVRNAPQSTVLERVVSVTPAEMPVGTGPGNAAYPSTAYGSSSAGSTASGGSTSAGSSSYGSSGGGATSSGGANASAEAASGTAPASTGAAPGTPQSSVGGEGGQSGAMMPEPTKPIQPSHNQQQQQ